MSPRLRFGLIAAFAAVAILAILGWARKPADVAPYNAGYSVPAYDANAGYATPANNPSAAPVSLASYDVRQSPDYRPANAPDPCLDRDRAGYGYAERAYEPPAYARRYNVRTVRTRVVEQRAPVYVERRVVRRGRSTKKSVAIVAGSAGVGAAIGAIAGGGKGAGIGALAGGAGGFVYDRLTHNRR